jgi:hypothetical protein
MYLQMNYKKEPPLSWNTFFGDDIANDINDILIKN